MHQRTGPAVQEDGDNVPVTLKGSQVQGCPALWVLVINLVLVAVQKLIHSLSVAIVGLGGENGIPPSLLTDNQLNLSKLTARWRGVVRGASVFPASNSSGSRSISC